MAANAVGLDISERQGVIDWARVNADFVMVRASCAMRPDARFSRNIAGAGRVGIKYGVYHEARAASPDSIRAQATCFLQQIAASTPALPCALWADDARIIGGRGFGGQIWPGLHPEQQFVLLEAFFDPVCAAGYQGMLYMPAAALSRLYRYDRKRLGRWALWVSAPDSARPAFGGPWRIWQYSWLDGVPGIPEPVSLDYADRTFIL